MPALFTCGGHGPPPSQPLVIRPLINGWKTTKVAAMATAHSFNELNIPERLKSALRRLGFETLTPVQQATIGPALNGRDVLGSSQTGTGKTAAYAIPVLSWL